MMEEDSTVDVKDKKKWLENAFKKKDSEVPAATLPSKTKTLVGDRHQWIQNQLLTPPNGTVAPLVKPSEDSGTPSTTEMDPKRTTVMVLDDTTTATAHDETVVISTEESSTPTTTKSDAVIHTGTSSCDVPKQQTNPPESLPDDGVVPEPPQEQQDSTATSTNMTAELDHTTKETIDIPPVTTTTPDETIDEPPVDDDYYYPEEVIDPLPDESDDDEDDLGNEEVTQTIAPPETAPNEEEDIVKDDTTVEDDQVMNHDVNGALTEPPGNIANSSKVDIHPSQTASDTASTNDTTISQAQKVPSPSSTGEGINSGTVPGADPESSGVHGSEATNDKMAMDSVEMDNAEPFVLDEPSPARDPTIVNRSNVETEEFSTDHPETQKLSHVAEVIDYNVNESSEGNDAGTVEEKQDGSWSAGSQFDISAVPKGEAEATDIQNSVKEANQQQHDEGDDSKKTKDDASDTQKHVSITTSIDEEDEQQIEITPMARSMSDDTPVYIGDFESPHKLMQGHDANLENADEIGSSSMIVTGVLSANDGLLLQDTTEETVAASNANHLTDKHTREGANNGSSGLNTIDQPKEHRPVRVKDIITCMSSESSANYGLTPLAHVAIHSPTYPSSPLNAGDQTGVNSHKFDLSQMQFLHTRKGKAFVEQAKKNAQKLREVRDDILNDECCAGVLPKETSKERETSSKEGPPLPPTPSLLDDEKTDNEVTDSSDIHYVKQTASLPALSPSKRSEADSSAEVNVHCLDSCTVM